MKFLDEHSKEIRRVIESSGIDQNDFSYVKRRGRIFILYINGERQFGYLRKKVTRLNPKTKQWEHDTHFLLKIDNGPEIQVENWRESIQYFEKWLASFNQ